MKNISDESEITKAILNKQNILLSGSAGTGKSYTASKIVRSIPGCALTATTGIAALNIGGETLCRFLSINTTSRPEEAEHILNKWDRIQNSNKPWDVARTRLLKGLKTLIIDEVSMLRRDQFELIDVVLSFIKDRPTTFGGVNLMLIGDLFQLPPVITNSDLIKFDDLKNPYCFQSDLWAQANFTTFNLTHNYRQGEGEFLNALEKIRRGEITPEVDDLMRSRVGAILNTTLEPVRLFTHKIDVAQENLNRLKLLPGDKLLSEAEFSGKEYDCEILARECSAEKNLYFGVGAQIVMLVNDRNDRWVNGTMGTVIDTDPVRVCLSDGGVYEVEPYAWERKCPTLNRKTGEIEYPVVATLRQFPFSLAWSTTTHKSQGQTLDYVDADLSKCFATGQAYCALSRVKKLEGLRLKSWDKNCVKVDERVKEFYK